MTLIGRNDFKWNSSRTTAVLEQPKWRFRIASNQLLLISHFISISFIQNSKLRFNVEIGSYYGTFCFENRQIWTSSTSPTNNMRPILVWAYRRIVAPRMVLTAAIVQVYADFCLFWGHLEHSVAAFLTQRPFMVALSSFCSEITFNDV